MESNSLSPSKNETAPTETERSTSLCSSSSTTTTTTTDDGPSDEDILSKQLVETKEKPTPKFEFKDPSSKDKVCEQKSKKIYKFKCKFSGTICDVLTRKGWVEQEDEFSDDWDIFWCDVNQLRDLFIASNTRILEHQRISHFRSCFEICRKNLMVKNLKRLQSRIKKTFGKEESEKMNFFPTTYILPMDHKFFLQEFKRGPSGYWIIKPAAGAQGRGIVIFSQLSEYNSWRKQYHEALRQLHFHLMSSSSAPPPTGTTVTAAPESVARYVALSLSSTQLKTVEGPPFGHASVDNEDSDSDSETTSTVDDTTSTSENQDEIGSKDDIDNPDIPSRTISSNKLPLEKGGDGPDNCVTEPECKDFQSQAQQPAATVGDGTGNANNGKRISEQTDAPTRNLRADVFVLQRYIDDPYLIGGRKFDLRLFVLVTSYKPLKAWLYRDGFARFCSESFSMSCTQNMYIHLTNVAVQRTSENYDEDTDLKWSLKKFRSFLQARHGRQEVFNFMSQVDTIVVRTLQSILNVVIPDRNSFELYGFDVIIDSNIKPWLLEVNASPAFTPSSEEDYRLKCSLIDDTMNVLDVEGRRSGKERQVGSFDLFWDNGPVYAEPTCHYGTNEKKARKPKLNTFLGCESNRVEKLREMYKTAHTLQRTQKLLEGQPSLFDGL